MTVFDSICVQICLLTHCVVPLRVGEPLKQGHWELKKFIETPLGLLPFIQTSLEGPSSPSRKGFAKAAPAAPAAPALAAQPAPAAQAALAAALRKKGKVEAKPQEAKGSKGAKGPEIPKTRIDLRKSSN